MSLQPWEQDQESVSGRTLHLQQGPQSWGKAVSKQKKDTN